MKNLVIGNTSQLSHYFPNNYIKIPSRGKLSEGWERHDWDSVYITFAEQRVYDKNIDFITPNYINTLQLIEALLPNSNRIVCYTTCWLWSKLSGRININTLPCFDLNNEYTLSKLLLWNKIKELRTINSNYYKVVFIHPFRFISIHQNKRFLFSKVFDSIINKKNIFLDNICFYRDLQHAKDVVYTSINALDDTIIGSGNLYYIKQLLIDLYKRCDMNFHNYVTYSRGPTSNQELIMAHNTTENKYAYEELIENLYIDIKWKQSQI